MNKHCHERPENSGALLIDRGIRYILNYIYSHNKRYPQEMGVDEFKSLEVVWKVLNTNYAIAPHTALN
ncbi:MAG: hypothetical protein V7L00_21075 [Nostoc sp.]|uniref:hypothetical protein n=1 Tax=Nostoc sp. TaxID=1180 RepID=UPI002FF6127D